jgi:ring-1,2-phenylacetyl-CoA epoxidase subunit PaaD
VVNTATQQLIDAVRGVRDPEIPAVTLGDLGVVQRVEMTPGRIEVDLLPTFVGCPALDIIKRDVQRAVGKLAGERSVMVTFVFDPPWTTDRISDEGKASMKLFGIAPPNGTNVRPMQPLLQIAVRCPYCGSLDTVLESDFGPTLCRSIRYCNACKNPFEGFKPKEE